MKQEHSQALIIAYYLSKFDDLAYRNLGFERKTRAHHELGRILGINPNSVKNMRDEFDSVHDNNRSGWHQRPLRPSRVRVLNAFQELPEEELRQVVLQIIEEAARDEQDHTISGIVNRIVSPKSGAKREKVFIVRGPTGRKAEDYFVEYCRQECFPVRGKLVDMRDMGCGYDFEVRSNDIVALVEVKGMNMAMGGISFTSKEWEKAKQAGISYYLVIVSNLFATPEIRIINNPAATLNPKKSIIETVQIRWNVPSSEL